MVLENLANRQLRFFRIEFKVKDDDTECLNLIQLGLLTNVAKDKDISPIVKSRSKVFTDDQGKFSHQLVAIRENGRVDFYSNFMLVSDYFDENEPVVDVETGSNFFCIKMRKNNKDIDDELYRCIKFKFSRLGMRMGQTMTRVSDFDIALHDRIAPYFNLYKQFINFMTYFLVSHRNHISIFDVLRGKWTGIKTFKDTVGFMAVKKRKKISELAKRLFEA